MERERSGFFAVPYGIMALQRKEKEGAALRAPIRLWYNDSVRAQLAAPRLIRRRMPLMRLISWNVNGLRACLTKGFADYFASCGADAFFLQ